MNRTNCSWLLFYSIDISGINKQASSGRDRPLCR